MMTRHRNDGLRKRCGCRRRQWAKCEHPWHLNFKWDDRHYRLSLDRYAGRSIVGKTGARQAADTIRAAIRAGTFTKHSDSVPATADALTLRAFADVFLERYSKAREKASWRNDKYMLDRIVDFPTATGRFGDKPIGAITEDDIEVFLTHMRQQGRAASTRNQYLQVFKAMSAWGVRKGYLTRPWINVTTELRREKISRRNRRLRPGEEESLLEAANRRLYRLIIAALETGCRLGELLSLQWREVSQGRRELRLLAEKTKDKDARILPLSSRLLAVLEMATTDPSGHPFDSDAYVFGDEVGRPVKSVKKAWQTACEKAGVTNLKFHDLRHEAGSRFLEAGWPLHHVKEMLGHADIKTTDTYLNVTRIGLHESMRRFEVARETANTVPVKATPGRGRRQTASIN